MCVFAYGQTGSGKTHTMEGPSEDPGINFRTMQELFRVINSERKASHSHAISASIVEIYNEQVRWPMHSPHIHCSTPMNHAIERGAPVKMRGFGATFAC